jgi:signal transduction histidine kinase
MKFRNKLRSRVALSFAMMGMVVSIGLASALYVLNIDMEEGLVAETLTAELEDYIARYEKDPETPPPASTTIQMYVMTPDDQDAPDVLRKLGQGLHQVQLDGNAYYAEVRISGGKHFVVLYGDKQLRQRENQLKLFLVMGVVVMTIFSALIGLWLAKRVISPVVVLASRVAGLRSEPHPVNLADDFPHDEVGVLAHEFDAYLQRLAVFIEREQEFTADVSHELRTPLAVIEGATEVLLDDPELDDARRTRVERIARSAHEMCELVTALLVLAREEKKGVTESGCEVENVLRQIIEGHQHLLRHKPVEIRLSIQAQPVLPVECTLLHVVLANLIRNAIYYTDQGYVDILLDEKGISVTDTGIGISSDEIQKVFDRYYSGATGNEGIGLSLVKRICHRYGWNIDIQSIEGEGTLFRLSFSNPPAA